MSRILTNAVDQNQNQGSESRAETKRNQPLETPFVIVVDSREQLNYEFLGLRTDYRQNYRPISVQTTKAALPAGDYSLAGHESQIAVERKSLQDLYSTLGQGRARFERELHRLDNMQYAAVVIEAQWDTILADPPPRSQLRPKTVIRSIIAWQQRWPRVHWWPVPGREVGEAVTFRILERYWKNLMAKN